MTVQALPKPVPGELEAPKTYDGEAAWPPRSRPIALADDARRPR
jgi:hypothetical protein